MSTARRNQLQNVFARRDCGLGQIRTVVERNTITFVISIPQLFRNYNASLKPKPVRLGLEIDTPQAFCENQGTRIGVQNG